MSFKLTEFNQSQVNVIKALINNQRNLMTGIELCLGRTSFTVNQFIFGFL